MEAAALHAAHKFAILELPMEDDSDASNILFSIHPRPNSRGGMEITIATDHILNIILEQVTWLDVAEQFRFFTMISRDLWLESPLGRFYEKLICVRLTADLTAAPLICTSMTQPSIPVPIVSNVIPLSSSLDLKDANQNNLPFYWRPVSQNFTSLDAIICTLEEIFLLKTSVSSQDSLKILDLNFIHEHIPTHFWQKRQCYLVFVTPDQDCATWLTSKAYSILQEYPELEVCCCLFPIGMSTFTLLQLDKIRKLSVRILLCFIVHLLI
jgi:hypothetical protein